MERRIIKINYQPAIKCVKFYNEQGESINSETLQNIEDNVFVLEQYGEKIFDDISIALNGVDEINIYFNGTTADFECLKKLTDYYNNNCGGSIKFSCKHSGELADMDELYSKIKDYAKNAVSVINNKILDIGDNDNELRKKFKDNLIYYTKEINQKIISLESTNINICFVGAYSSGKSSLINAIIGERILPEADRSKTAKFFIISAPKEEEFERIEFRLGGENLTVIWNGAQLVLEENNCKHEALEEVSDCIKENCCDARHRQFYNFLECINDNPDFGDEVKIFYPLDLINKDSMSFTIYDTPGTDSNNPAHKAVLSDALKEQNSSIVVFVCAVKHLEGEGNSALLEMLSGENKHSIDIDRSIFVINQADSSDKEQLKTYYNEKLIMNRDTEDAFEIPLEGKKLLFTSAAQANAALAYKINQQSEKDEEYYDCIKKYPFYSLNRYGYSDALTAEMIKEAQNKYDDTDNEYDKAFIHVGLYSLVSSIREYGKKYAVATKVCSLYENVNKMLQKLDNDAETDKRLCDMEIDKLTNDLVVIEDKIEKAVNGEYEKRCPKEKKSVTWMTADLSKRLNMDAESTKRLQNDIKRDVKKVLYIKKKQLDRYLSKDVSDKKKIRNAKKIKKKEDKSKKLKTKYFDEVKFQDIVNDIMESYFSEFNKAQKEVLFEVQTGYKQAVISIINNDSDLTDVAKKYLKLCLPNETIDIKDFDYIKISSMVEEVLKNQKYVQVEEMIESIEDWSIEVLSKLHMEFEGLYRKNLYNILTAIKDNFMENKANYFVKVDMLQKDKQLVLDTADEISGMVDILNKLSDELKSIAWKVWG